jgi:hypothetical protein
MGEAAVTLRQFYLRAMPYFLVALYLALLGPKENHINILQLVSAFFYFGICRFFFGRWAND